MVSWSPLSIYSRRGEPGELETSENKESETLSINPENKDDGESQ
jgi:hypothetical protein